MTLRTSCYITNIENLGHLTKNLALTYGGLNDAPQKLGETAGELTRSGVVARG